jgi:hypothetical protein
MAIKYNLTIDKLEKITSLNEFNNVINAVSVVINAYSEEYPDITYECSGDIKLDVSKIIEDQFISFEEITQEVVLDWILKKEGVETVEEFSLLKFSIANIQSRINNLNEKELIDVNWTISN